MVKLIGWIAVTYPLYRMVKDYESVDSLDRSSYN